MSAQDKSPITGTRHRFVRLLGVGAVLGLGGCVSWPGYGPSWESSSYYGSSYEAYGGVYEKRYDMYPYDYGLPYGRPFYTTYGAYPPGFYYDPRFLGHGRPVRPQAPPAAPPPAPDPVATPAPPPRLGPRPSPDQPVYRPVPRADPVARPAPPPPPQRRQPHHRIPQ